MEETVARRASSRSARPATSSSRTSPRRARCATSACRTTTKKKDYKLDDAKTTITVTFKDGRADVPRRWLGLRRQRSSYVVDQASGKAYVFVEGSDLAARDRRVEPAPHSIRAASTPRRSIRSRSRRAARRRRSCASRDRRATASEGQDVGRRRRPRRRTRRSRTSSTTRTTCGRPSTRRRSRSSDMTAGPEAHVQGASTARRARHAARCYKHEKPGELAEGQELDPANPPKGETEYYIMTEKTRVPGARAQGHGAAHRERHRDGVRGKTEPSSVEPQGNPFGNGRCRRRGQSARRSAAGAGCTAAAPVTPHAGRCRGAPPHAVAPRRAAACDGRDARAGALRHTPPQPATPPHAAGHAGSPAPAAAAPAAPAATGSAAH